MKYFLGLMLALLALCVWPVQSSDTTSLTTALNEQLAVNAERYGVVGQSVLILKNHQPVFRGVHGYANKELGVKVNTKHIFPSYSITKLITSVLVMQLVERGEIALTDRIIYHLPYLPQEWKDVTIDHLINHTSGIPRYFDAVLASGEFLSDKRAVYASLAGKPAHFDMGTGNRYNNTNFLVLASLLEDKTLKSYTQLVKEIVIDPLNLKNTGHASAKQVVGNMVSSYQGNNGSLIKNIDIDWPEYTFSHSALYSTPEELGKFVTALMKGAFVKPETLKNLFQPMGLTIGKPGRYATGFEFSIEDGFTRVGHDGGNRVKVRHYFSSDKKADSYTLVYMTNGNTFDVWTDVLADSVMSTVAPEVFTTAKLKEQFLGAALARDTQAMNAVFTSLMSQNANDAGTVERFLLYRAYALRYGSGPESAMVAFEFLLEKFPDSKGGIQGLKDAKLALEL